MNREKYMNNSDYREGYDSGVLDGRKQIMKMHEDFIKGIEKLKFDIDTEFEKPLDEIPKINRKAYLNDWL